MNDLIKKIDETGDTKRKQGSGRPRSVRTADNVAKVEELISSQEDQPGTSKSPREIERQTGRLYLVELFSVLLPDIIAHSGENFTFQQDGALAHRSRKTVAFLTAHVPDFIEPENWPPNSPDLNPVDYSIWGMLQQLVYRQRIRDIEHLKEVLTACWDEISEDTINRAIGQFRKRLSLVIAANGGHIEHHFD